MCQVNENSPIYYRIRALAREMRKNATDAEKIFWDKVRNRKLLGLKWNRQYIIECQRNTLFKKYSIADMHCHFLKLVVEIDGEIHKKYKDEDLIRTEELNGFGFKAVRFSNDRVLNNWQEVEKIITEI